jgi:thioredoxin reductase (NADPH)
LSEPREVVIVGSGPSGLTAAVYTARANLQPLVVEGLAAGGQLMLTTDVENYPGFPEGIMGPDLMQRFREQAERFGAEFVTADADAVRLTEGSPFTVTVGSDTHTARSVIVSTGASALMLGLPNEDRLLGHGVSTCATCDGFFFREQEIAVVGGGDTAIEEALFLTKFASKVTVVHRRDELRASKVMQDRAFANPKIAFRWNSVVDDVLGETKLEGARLRDTETGDTEDVSLTGLFVAIGHTPNTDLFKGQLELDDNGYIITSAGSTRTSIEGVFAAGDVADHVYRQAITAAGTGCMAAIDAERWLAEAAHAAATAAG